MPLRFPLTSLRPYITTPRVALAFLYTTSAIITFKGSLGDLTSIRGASMQPTLSPNYHLTGAKDYVLTHTRKPTHDLRRGDIVCIMSPSRPESNSIKRVIGLEGDTVILDPCRRPGPLRNGDDSSDAKSWDAWRGKVKVPHGHMWLEGDNWRDSRDSNHYGPASRSLVVGRATRLVTWGSRFGLEVGRGDGFESETEIIVGKCNGCEKARMGGEAAAEAASGII